MMNWKKRFCPNIIDTTAKHPNDQEGVPSEPNPTTKAMENKQMFDKTQSEQQCTKDTKSGGVHKEVQVGNDQEMAQSERNSYSINRGTGKT